MKCKTKTGLMIMVGSFLSAMTVGMCHADPIYASYEQKLQEMIQTYGEPGIDVFERGSDADLCLTGLTDAFLADFDQDGTEDLLLSYYAGGELQTDEDGRIVLPDAADYRLEIWSDQDGALEALCAGQQAGEYQEWTFNGEWSKNCCLYHVWEKDGKPYLQIYEHTSGLESGLVFRNIRFEGGNPEVEEYGWNDGVFTVNGEETQPEAWMDGVIGDALLHAAVLTERSVSLSRGTNDEILPESTEQTIQTEATLQNLKETIKLLEDSEKKKDKKEAPSWARLYLYKIVQSILFNHTYSYASYSRVNDILDVFDQLGLGENTQTDEDFQNEGGLFMDSTHAYEYAIWDLDHDGIPELILRDMPNAAGTFLEIYTVSDDRLILCDRSSFSHENLLMNADGDLVRHSGHMGLEDFKLLQMKDGQVTYEKIEESVLQSGLSINEIPDQDTSNISGLREEYSIRFQYFNPASFFVVLQNE